MEEEKFLLNPSNYNQVKHLKHGKLGRSFLFKSKANKRKLVFKYVAFTDNSHFEQFSNDIQNLKRCVHPSLTHFEGYMPISSNFTCMIATSYIGTTLEEIFNRTEKNEKIPNFGPSQKIIILIGIAGGLKFLHSQNIAHKNLKPSNVLIDKNFRPLLSDFYFTYIDESCSNYEFDEPKSYANDIAAFGSIIYELFTGKSMDAKLEKGPKGKPQIPQETPTFISELIQQCWNDTPNLRPSANDIFSLIANNLPNILPDADIQLTRNYLSLLLAFERERLMSIYGDMECTQNFAKFLLETSSSMSYQVLGNSFLQKTHKKSESTVSFSMIPKQTKNLPLIHSGSSPDFTTVIKHKGNKNDSLSNDSMDGNGVITPRKRHKKSPHVSKDEKKSSELSSDSSLTPAKRKTPRSKRKHRSLPIGFEKPKDFIEDPILSIKQGNLASLKYHIQGLEYNPHTKNKMGQSLLHIAAQFGQLSILQYLMSLPKMSIDTPADWGRTPLHYAAENGHLNIVQYIVSLNNGNASEISDDGRTPLHEAASECQTDVVKFLLTCKNLDINKRDANGYTALHYAAQSGHSPVVSLLISTKGIDINIKDEEGKTPLHYASGEGKIEVMNILLDMKGIIVNSQDKDGKTPLHYAALLDQTKAVERLLAFKGIDPSIRDEDGDTAYDCATNDNIKSMIVKKMKK